MYTTGGRGGKVYEVTNLDDSGPGSLREAIDAVGTRTVVFRVSGTIDLKSRLTIKNPGITIAGQTSPGDGICLKRDALSVSADNVIVRFLRIRPGDLAGREMDSLGGRYHKDIMIDHCSACWSIDECVSFYRNENVTVQWCLVAESLRKSKHAKGPHGYGGIWGGHNGTYHHNLLASHSSRNPRFASEENVDYRNNVIFNWGFNSAYGGEEAPINIVANYYKFGPATIPGVKARIFGPSTREDSLTGEPLWGGRYYIADNFVWGFPEITADNWAGGVQGDFPEEKIRVDVPFPAAPVQTQSAEQAYETVLAFAGAIFPKRDAYDERIVQTVVTGYAPYGETWFGGKTGIIDSQDDVGGWPELQEVDPLPDTDHDGMDDDYERRHGFDPDDPADGAQDKDGDGYTNLEELMNRTDPDEFVDYTNPANNVNSLHR
ncbi:pectate lyase [Candidatus Sumerlaeota bacterium]|nr:pectate lyase [Candidatus Sumerlaeota bacterium]